MKISLKWLENHITFNKGITLDQIVWRLTEAAAEVERVEKVAENLASCVVGKIMTIKKHANADKLKLCDTDIGGEKVQIVCGGTNLKEGMKVAVALPGASVRWHGQGEPVVLEKAKIRGEESFGMICLASELSLESVFEEKSDTEILDLSDLKAKPGQALAEALELDDTVLHIDNHAITHRPDLFSHIGIAREFVAMGMAKWNTRKKKKIAEGKGALPFEITTSDKTLWTHYEGIIIDNLDTRQSPMWMKRRLSACGIRAINAIVDITNYVMLDTGMPAHAFDMKKIGRGEFITRLSKKGEKVVTLDGVERTMPEGIIVIENNGKIIDLCGLMGGENSGIDEKTKNVFFHAVTYEPVRIRKAMIALGHRTEAGTVFEKGVARELPEVGMDRIIELVTEIFPEAKIISKRFVKKQYHDEKRVLSITHAKIEEVLGIAIDPKEVVKTLTGLGFSAAKSGKKYRVTVPFWRRNGMNIPEDIIEEVVRIYGYSKVNATLPMGSIQPPEKHIMKILARNLREVLIGHGFFEEQNYSFLGQQLLSKFGWTDNDALVEIKNPVSDDLKFVRPSLLPYLLANASRNIRQNEPVRSFELQKTFVKKGEDVFEETLCVGVIAEKNGVLKAKGALEDIFAEAGIPVEFSQAQDLPFGHPGKSLVAISGGETVGSAYELKPTLRRNFELPEGAAVLEVRLEKMAEKKVGLRKYAKISKFPHVMLDINVVVDRTTRAKEVESWIRGVEKALLVKLTLKDVYEGKNLGENKKSLTYALTYQAFDKTLADEDVQAIIAKVIQALEKNGGVVRR